MLTAKITKRQRTVLYIGIICMIILLFLMNYLFELSANIFSKETVLISNPTDLGVGLFTAGIIILFFSLLSTLEEGKQKQLPKKILTLGVIISLFATTFSDSLTGAGLLSLRLVNVFKESRLLPYDKMTKTYIHAQIGNKVDNRTKGITSCQIDYTIDFFSQTDKALSNVKVASSDRQNAYDVIDILNEKNIPITASKAGTCINQNELIAAEKEIAEHLTIN